MSSLIFDIKRTRLPADETTPVRLYRQLRTYFSPAVLLESNNFEQARDTQSIIGVDPLIELRYQKGELHRTYYPDAQESHEPLDRSEVFGAFQKYIKEVEYSSNPGPVDGFFGFTSFDAYRFVEPDLRGATAHDILPDLHYFFFRFVLVIDHFHENLEIVEFIAPGKPSRSQELIDLLKRSLPEPEHFSTEGEEQSNLNDQEHEELVKRGIDHCLRGDTFQVVLSRRYEQAFSGDDFNVYKQLRRLNPSPYCFYFDFGPYRIFGSSPESLLTVRDGRATIHPIAGTAPVIGDELTDDQTAAELLADPKENAEHRMLVDLARNDLSRTCFPVRVDYLRKIERYSHLMHIVSQVSGEIEGDSTPYDIYTTCFPAGTLSGAPKFKAVELIYAYEQEARGAYGGGIGYLSPRGNFDHCIIIRSAVVIGNTLHYQAGGGIVAQVSLKRSARK